MQQMQSTATVLRTWVGRLPPTARDQIERDWATEGAAEAAEMDELPDDTDALAEGVTADDISW